MACFKKIVLKMQNYTKFGVMLNKNLWKLSALQAPWKMGVGGVKV